MREIQSTIGVLVVGILSACIVGAQEKVAQSGTTANEPSASCPVTTPLEPAFVPPEPYPGKASNGNFYFGTAKLWTLVWKSPWRALPKWDVGYRQKIFWWSQGYDWRGDPQPQLSITGKRLDGPAPPLVTDDQANGSYRGDMQSFVVSGVSFPTTGCWEITGRLHGDELRFVVWVGK